MSPWKLFKKSKKQNQPTVKEIEIPTFEEDEPTNQEQEQPIPEEQQTEKEPVTEYHQTLYSSDHPEHRKTTGRRWESTSTIEHNVDNIGHKPISSKVSGTSEVINEKVDRLLSKKGVKPISETTQKKQEIPEGYIAKKNKRTGLTYYTKE